MTDYGIFSFFTALKKVPYRTEHINVHINVHMFHPTPRLYATIRSEQIVCLQQ